LKLEEAIATAKAQENAGEWDAARRTLAGALARAPDDAALHARMGWYVYNAPSTPQDQRLAEALGHLDRSNKLDPTGGEAAHYYRGCIFTREGNFTRARAELKTALRIRPTFVQAKEALTALGDKGAASPGAVAADDAPIAPAAGRRPHRAWHLLAAIALIALAAAASASFVFRSRRYETNISNAVISREDNTLKVEVGPMWKLFSGEQQQRELRHVVESARRMGARRVVVLGRGKVVAEAEVDP